MGKRSAEAEPVSAPDADSKAEANPWYGYYGHGLGYYGLGYYGHYGYPYLYGKRSAEADPYLLYGYYGLGHHYGGYYGYGYPYYGGYYYGKDEVPRFLTTTCFVFSTSEKSKCSKQNFFKLAAFKHLYILCCGIFACIPDITFKTSRKNEKCVILVA